MTWFEDLTGFRESSPEQVRRDLILNGETLTSNANGRRMVCGRLETPALSELREQVRRGERGSGKISLKEVIANVQALHADPANAGALSRWHPNLICWKWPRPAQPRSKGWAFTKTTHPGSRLRRGRRGGDDLPQLFCPAKWSNRAIGGQPDRLPGGPGSGAG